MRPQLVPQLSLEKKQSDKLPRVLFHPSTIADLRGLPHNLPENSVWRERLIAEHGSWDAVPDIGVQVAHICDLCHRYGAGSLTVFS